MLIPAIQDSLHISLALASVMVPAQQLPSIGQPFVGAIADRVSRRWFVVLAPACAAISFSMVGLAPNVIIVLALLLVSGTVSACFHPPAIALVTDYGGKKLGRAMAYFMAGGDLARSIGPLVMTAAIALLTLHGSVAVMVFGIASSLILFATLDTHEVDAKVKASEHPPVWPLVRARLRPIVAVISFSVIIGATSAPYTYFLVKLLQTRGRSDWYAGLALSIFAGAGVIGGLLGGSLSDRLGRRLLMVLASLATAPLFYLYLSVENGSAYVLLFIALAGLAARSARPVALALAQEMLPEARGTMAGVAQAINFVTLSLAALAFGALADAIGINTAFWWCSAASLLGLLCIPFVQRRGEPLAQPAVATPSGSD